MDAIWELAAQHNLYVVEDAAHAIGTLYKGLPIGAADPKTGRRSDAVAYSFYATKNLTTGEGGMVTTHNEELRQRMQVLCLHGISKDAWNRYSEKGKWFYEVVAGGFKYNLSDLQSSIGIHQLRKQEEFIAARTRYADRYDRAFAGLPAVECPPRSADARHCWHLYMLSLNLERMSIDRDEFMERLKERGIGASVHFIPIPLHPFYREMAQLPENQCPKTMALFPRLVSLPLYPSMTEEQIDYIAASVRDILGYR